MLLCSVRNQAGGPERGVGGVPLGYVQASPGVAGSYLFGSTCLRI